jgi:hypothetical protein
MCNKAKQQTAHLVGNWADPESPTGERGEVLLITVERVGKILLARVQFHIEGRVKLLTCGSFMQSVLISLINNLHRQGAGIVRSFVLGSTRCKMPNGTSVR